MAAMVPAAFQAIPSDEQDYPAQQWPTVAVERPQLRPLEENGDERFKCHRESETRT